MKFEINILYLQALVSCVSHVDLKLLRLLFVVEILGGVNDGDHCLQVQYVYFEFHGKSYDLL